MPLLTLGINHKTAPVHIREQVAFSPEHLQSVHQALVALPGVSEAVVLSTCNRSELYLAGPQLDEHKITHWLAEYHQLQVDDLQPAIYQHSELSMVRHLARVAAGLDSLVLGEPQILGQLKSAFAVSQEAGTLGKSLMPVFQHCFSIAKGVRSNTAIGQNPVSVAYAAVDLATHIFADLSQCTAVLVGAGETIDLVAKHLTSKGIGQLIIANRTLSRAAELARQFGAKAVLLGDLPEVLPQGDIVISSTASQLPIIGKGMVEQALKQRRHQPVFMVDIAVPRDIEPEVAKLNDVFLYTVDDLQQVISKNVASRQAAASEAEIIIDDGLKRFSEQMNQRSAGVQVSALREQMAVLVEQEVSRHQKYLDKGDDPKKVMARLGQSIAAKVLHQPTDILKNASPHERQRTLAELEMILGLTGKQDEPR